MEDLLAKLPSDGTSSGERMELFSKMDLTGSNQLSLLQVRLIISLSVFFVLIFFLISFSSPTTKS